MKTRAKDLEDAVKEALQMLARGRPADAQETLSAALDAPTEDRAVRRGAQDPKLERALREFGDMVPEDVSRAARRAVSSARDAALAEVEVEMKRRFRENEFYLTPHDVRSMMSAPAQVVSLVKVREVLLEIYDVGRRVQAGGGHYPESQGRTAAVEYIARRLGVDLDAAPTKAPTPSTARHWLNDVRECSDECPACNENRARGLNPDGTVPEGSR